MSTKQPCGHSHPSLRAPLPDGALAVMRDALPAPYDRGMERMTVPLDTPQDGGPVTVPAYDFDRYERFYGRPPASPRYLLAPRQDVTEPLTVRVAFTRATGAEAEHDEHVEHVEHVDVRIPAGHPGGRAVTIPIPGRAAEVTDRLRLASLAPLAPATTFGTVTWEVTALLGNLAKLLWVIGAEHEIVAEQLRDVTAQRNTETAHGVSLDLLGLDLGAPRFPPRPHTVDGATIALFHLDDVPPSDSGELPAIGAEVTTVTDAAAPTRQGVNKGARSGRTGRFAHAFGFGPGESVISVADAPAFALPATADFTVEAVVRPDGTAATGATAPGAPGVVVAKQEKPGTPEAKGWALTFGTFRGIDHNLRFSVSDGRRTVEVFADRDLADGAFHHVAGVLAREAETAAVLLHVDGREVARKGTETSLGVLTSTAKLVIGRATDTPEEAASSTQYTGLIEEVRLSSAARDAFDPVTGEPDEQYRRRLRIFHRWLLPTPDGLQAAVNAAAGPVADPDNPDEPGDPEPFVVRERTEVLATGGRNLRVLPTQLPVSQSITAEGAFGTPEETAVGTAARDEPDFDPAWLLSHPDRPGLTFADDENSRRMQLGVVRALDALLDRLAAGPDPGPDRGPNRGPDRPPGDAPAQPAGTAAAAGTLRVLKAYDPTATGLHGVGRAVLLTHEPTIGPARLGALAHAAGFGWVHHTRDGHIYAAQPRGDVFRIVTRPTEAPPGQPDVTEGGALVLGIEPDPSRLPDAEVHWSVLRSGAGDAVFPPREPGTLRARAAGDVSVRVEVVRHGHVGSGTRVLRIGLSDSSLSAGHAISGTGRRDATEAAAAGPPTPGFDPRMLRVRTDDLTQPPRRVAYGTEPGNRLTQRVTAAALDRLLDLLSDTPGNLLVLTSYVPEAPTAPPPDDPTPADPDTALHTQGRALRLRHPTLTAPALAARAFAAAFDHIRIDAPPPTEPDEPETVRVAVAPGEQLTVTARAGPEAEDPVPLRPGAEDPVPLGTEVEDPVPLHVEARRSLLVEVDPAAEPSAACFAADGSRVFLAEPGTHRITSFALAANPPRPAPRIRLDTSRRVAPFPGALAFGGGHLFVAHEALNRIAVLTPATLEPATTPPGDLTCPGPAALATDTTRLYAGCGDRTLRAFALTTGAQAASLALPAAPRSLAVAADTPSLFAVLDDGRWCRVERSPLAVRETVDTQDPNAHSLAVTANGKKLYVICPGPGRPAGAARILAYRPPDRNPKVVIDGFPSGTEPVALTLSGDGKLLYVATEGPPPATGRVYVVDVATDRRLPQTFSPGRGGPALAASPSGAAYPPCLVIAPRHGGTVLLADPAPLAANPPGPPRLDAELPLGTGLGEVLAWSSTPDGHGAAEPETPGAPVSAVAGVVPGRVLLRAMYLPAEGLRPYQCEVRLKPALESKPGVVVTREQYDLVLNVLNWFHPLGVECRTDRLRASAGLDGEGADGPRLYTVPAYHVADPFSSPFIRLRKDGRDD
ncbi:LamG-like jellyroll fold domain-containing protein [Streptomyces sp. NPDC058486]|uniref:LamG-like jellyroll fold domain-containing protein n=1 Tax=unclassified Streptomyces TaxID=2593676 RepID=UPI00364E382B